MRLKDIIRSEKFHLDTGKWLVGHVPRAAFPMSRLKDKRYRYGPEYSWRLIKFDAGACPCRILILLNESREVMRARLGVEVNSDMVVLSDYEYHATEPGWHCHVSMDHIATIGSGAARQGKQKWPKQSSKKDFGVDQENALSLVARLQLCGAR